ncbi:MAG: arginase [Candidatus Sericytochromatia bacterium]
MKIKKSKIVDIIGSPISLASPEKGASMGPDAIRISGLRESLHHLDVDFRDLGNLPVLEEPFPPKEFPKGEIRYLDEVYDFMSQLKEKVFTSLTEGNFPLILGGDHSSALGSLAAVVKYHKSKGQKPGLIWFDAHADYNTEETSPSGNIHGMPLAVATGIGNDKLLSLFEGNFLDPHRCVLLGVRSVDPIEGKLLDDAGVTVLTMKDIDEKGIYQCVKEAIRISSRDSKNPIHLSFDIDGLDMMLTPGTGTPVLGGVTLREAHLLMELLAESEMLQSMDLVEVNPILDTKNQTALVAKSLIESALGKVIY